MRTAINIACIREEAILLVKKNETWILVGGKPNENEGDIDCILRECSEELPKAKFIVKDKYEDFIGETPHAKDQLMAKVYFGEVSGDITPAAEIAEAEFMTKEKALSVPLSDITKKIVTSLIHDGYL